MPYFAIVSREELPFMAAKKQKKSATKPKKKPVITQEAFLEHLIKVSLASIGGRDSGTDAVFKEQANRLTKQLKKLRKSK